jgi:hypothetical protein|tara:strand:- start:1276 stop:1464 length:189 start_codon:yes stop_codon:yes gene_type:complete
LKNNFTHYLFGLFKITKAAIPLGTHPQRVSEKTIMIDPQLLSKTAYSARKQLIFKNVLYKAI